MEQTISAPAVPAPREVGSVERLRTAMGMSLGASAGIHVAVSPHHFAESMVSGAVFVGGALAMLAVAIAAAIRPSRVLYQAAAVLSAGAILVYGLALVGPVPFVATHAESVGAIGVATKLVELVAFAAAINLAAAPEARTRRRGPAFAAAYPVLLVTVAAAYLARALEMSH